MSELPLEIPQSPTSVRQDLLGMADKLERLQDEQQEGGVVDQTLEAMNRRDEVVNVDLDDAKTELAEKEAIKSELQDEVAKIVGGIGDDDTVMVEQDAPKRDEVMRTRADILISRIGACNKQIKELESEIASLKARIDACNEDVQESTQYREHLRERPAYITEALGHIAMAKLALDNVAEVRPIPPLPGETYRYDPVAGATDLSEFITFEDELSPQYASIPIKVPSPMLASFEPVRESIPNSSTLPPVQIKGRLAKKYLRTNNNGRK